MRFSWDQYRPIGGSVGWLYRADEGGLWLGHLYIYAPRVFRPRGHSAR